MSITRRSFLRTGGLGLGAAGFLSAFERFGLGTASAAYSIDPAYKALVVVFLYGGNDTNNMVIPNDASGPYAYSKYALKRSPTSCDFSIPQPVTGDPASTLITPSNMGGSSFFLHPKMTRLAGLFNDTVKTPLAVLCNVGTLVEPTKKNPTDGTFYNPTTGLAATLPSQLMSHRDQQDEWQSAIANPDISATATGWGGRIADSYAAGSFPVVLSDAGSTLFTHGGTTSPIVISASGTFGLTSNDGGGNATFLSQLAGQASGQTLTYANQEIMKESLQYATTLNAALTANTVTWRAGTWDYPGDLVLELKKIAEVIAASGPLGLGLTKQVFFCSKGGFDTHANQAIDQADLLSEVDNALACFYDAMTQIGAGNKVVLATQSDFNRTFAPGAFSGTDHAWGTHQLILGNAVRGGRFFGTFPDLTTGRGDDMDGISPDFEGEGRWVPTTSVDQYAATLAHWFDPNLNLTTLFPNLAHFSPQTLNFLG
jgi:uncharacterized protein (DUF1501 family)